MNNEMRKNVAKHLGLPESATIGQIAEMADKISKLYDLKKYGLPETATDEEIRDAYHREMRESDDKGYDILEIDAENARKKMIAILGLPDNYTLEQVNKIEHELIVHKVALQNGISEDLPEEEIFKRVDDIMLSEAIDMENARKTH